MQRIKFNKKKFSKLIYPLILITVWVFICISNFTPNTFLTGWDNLHPEFNYSINLDRIFNSSWASYQGLGAPSAHSHASELPRMLIVGVLNLILPTNLVRYVFVFLSIIIGALGMYYLIKNTFLKNKDESLKSFSAFVASLFYMLNVGTIQHFIVPFEMFNIQYALLPWLFLFLIKFLETKRYVYLFVFALITFFAAPMAYAAMLWYAYFGALVIYLIIYSVINRKNKPFFISFLIILITILVSLFWLVPNLYFVFNYSYLVPQAKTNIIFSEEAFLTNQKYGNIADVFLNKGFLFDWQIKNTNATFEPVLKNWSDHLNNPAIQIISILFLCLVIIGILYSITKKNKYLIPFIFVFFYCAIVLMGTNPPFGFIWNELFSKINVLQEAIRFPFTKFSIIFIFSQAIFLGIGVYVLAKLIVRYLKFKGGGFLLILLTLFLFFIYSMPTFGGEYINKNLRIDIPNDYFKVFDFFKNQNKSERIANFPVNSLFGWFYTDWGYQGSGFLWYGIDQPILDRDFDRWYTTLEDYYDSINNAIYTNNVTELKEVLKKYAVDWIIIDEHVTSADSESAINLNSNLASSQFAYKESKDLLNAISEITKVVEFGKISIYKVELNLDTNFVEIFEDSTSATPLEKYSIFNTDNYARKTSESYFKETDDYIQYSNTKYTLTNNGYSLNIPQVYSIEKSVPANVLAKKENGVVSVKFKYNLPLIYINQNPIFTEQKETNIQFVANDSSLIYYITFANQIFKLTELDSSFKEFGVAQIDISKDLLINFYSQMDLVDLSSSFNLNNLSISDCVSADNNLSANSKILNKEIELSSVGLNVCAGTNIFAGGNNNKLYVLDLEFNSTTSTIPDVCIRFNVDCVNSETTRNDFTNGLWYRYSTFAESNLARLYISLILNNSVQENFAKISYRNIFINQFNLKSNINISAEILKRDLRINNTTFSVTPINNQVVIDFKFPKTFKYNLNYKDLTQIVSVTPKNCKSYVDPISISREFVNSDSQILFKSIDGFNCENINFYNINLQNGFLINLSGSNIQGSNLVLNVSDFYYKKVYYTNRIFENNLDSHYLFIPKLNESSLNGINIFLNNQSVGSIETINALKEISVTPITHSWLNKINLESTNKFVNSNSIKSVNQINSSLYSVELNKVDNPALLVLNQSKEKNWIAYTQDGVELQRYGDLESSNYYNSIWNNVWIIPENAKTIFVEYRVLNFQYIGYISSLYSVAVVFVFSAVFYKKRT